MAQVKITRWGCEDVRGAHAVWDVGGRHYLAEVTGIYQCETRSCWMLRGKHMDGTPTPDVAASYVELLERTYDHAEE